MFTIVNAAMAAKEHFHAYRFSDARSAFLMTRRKFGTRQAASQFAARYEQESKLRFVRRCDFGDECPSLPRRKASD